MISVTASKEEVVMGLTDLSYDEIIRIITEVDYILGDWVFTEALLNALCKDLGEEGLRRVLNDNR
jgi:hypothetical protein